MAMAQQTILDPRVHVFASGLETVRAFSMFLDLLVLCFFFNPEARGFMFFFGCRTH